MALSVDCPTSKQINNCLRVWVGQDGWPHWTELCVDGKTTVGLSHEEARDLLYAMQRIVAFLDRVELQNTKV